MHGTGGEGWWFSLVGGGEWGKKILFLSMTTLNEKAD